MCAADSRFAVFDDFPSLVWHAGDDLKHDYFNREWLAFTGRTAEQEMGDGWMEGIHPEDLDRYSSIYREYAAERKPFEAEFRLQHNDGEYHWITVFARPFRDATEDYSGYIGSCYDTTERKRQEQQLAYMAARDPLTGVLNRRSLEEEMKRAVARAKRGFASSLMFIDIDNFKLINDTLGHSSGDEALLTLIQLLREKLRSEDILARVGGDEFAMLLEGIDAEIANHVAERLRSTVQESSFILNGIRFNISLSIGLVAIDGGQPPSVLLSRADSAMYKAKAEGGNRVEVYRPDQDGVRWLSEANQMVIRLKDALRANLFCLHFQPIVSLDDGQVDHYEALIRLPGTTGELLVAGQFIAAAERFGMMPQLTRWVVQESIRKLQQHPSLTLSVNLSSIDFADESLLEFIESYLRECRVQPGRLRFEISETGLIRDLAQAERWIRPLRRLGCRFALDDFGVGFVSFVYLRNIPVDQLKIDGSFIRRVESDPTQLALVQGIHMMARSQGKQTLAKCVENEATARILREIGISHGQGYYLGRPGPQLPSAVR